MIDNFNLDPSLKMRLWDVCDELTALILGQENNCEHQAEWGMACRCKEKNGAWKCTMKGNEKDCVFFKRGDISDFFYTRPV